MNKLHRPQAVGRSHTEEVGRRRRGHGRVGVRKLITILSSLALAAAQFGGVAIWPSPCRRRRDGETARRAAAKLEPTRRPRPTVAIVGEEFMELPARLSQLSPPPPQPPSPMAMGAACGGRARIVLVARQRGPRTSCQGAARAHGSRAPQAAIGAGTQLALMNYCRRRLLSTRAPPWSLRAPEASV